MKRALILFGIIPLLYTGAHAVPAPSQYTIARLVSALHSAPLVALGEVMNIDTSDSGSYKTQFTTIKLLTIFKGGVANTDSSVVAMLNLASVGGYALNYKVGAKSILFFYDTPLDGSHLSVSGGDKFDVGAGDSILPPPVGLGFSTEFTYYQTLPLFSELIVSTLRDSGYISYLPVLPKSSDIISFRTWTTLTGGATIDSITISQLEGNRISFVFTYTPCPGPACPDIVRFIDTTSRFKQLLPGNYTVYRYLINSALKTMAPIAPDDSATFTVYPNATATLDRPVGGERPQPFTVAAMRSCVHFSVAMQPGHSGRLSISDLSGRSVASMTLNAGLQRIEWKGIAANGTGMYCYSFSEQGKLQKAGRFVLVR
jgi:hypothetical protein